MALRLVVRREEVNHLSYMAYVLKHKGRVFVHATILGIPLRGLVHDLSKFHPLEWRGIGRQFYPSTPEEKANNSTLFQHAKEHHRKINQHEVDHWYNGDGSCKQIPTSVLKEVMADWAAFGNLCLSKNSIRQHARQCYEKWARNYKMHNDTRQWIEDFVGVDNHQ